MSGFGAGAGAPGGPMQPPGPGPGGMAPPPGMGAPGDGGQGTPNPDELRRVLGANGWENQTWFASKIPPAWRYLERMAYFPLET